MQTADAVAAFLDAKSKRGLSPRTLEGYRGRLERFAQAYPVLPTEPEPVESHCAQFTNAETHDTHWRTITTLYRWLVKRRKIKPDDNPMPYAERPKLVRTVPRAFTDAEIAQLFAYPHDSRVRLLLRLMLRTGLRVGEAWLITPDALREHIRYVNGRAVPEASIVVRGKTGEREVPCDPELVTVLRHTLPWPWKSPDIASAVVARAMRRAGLTGRRASAHTLRHTFARAWRGDSNALQGIMWGHASKMLDHYRPYAIHRVMDEYQQQEWIA